MATKQTKEEKAAVKAAEASLANTKPQEVDVKEDSKASEVTVRWIGGERTYTKELHGKDFKALAKQFADKMKGQVVVL